MTGEKALTFFYKLPNRIPLKVLSEEYIENYDEAYMIVKEAIEKHQIPKISGCYICDDTSNSRYYKNKKYSYCPHCGQKLDWRDD